MKSFDFEGFALRDDDPPVLAFTVEMREGRDLDGKFRFRFAAAELDDEGPVFAILDAHGRAVQAMEYTDRVERLLDALIEHGEYVAGLNYEQMEWEVADGTWAVPLLSGSLGNQFDMLQPGSLPGTEVQALRKMRGVLKDRTDDT